MALEERNFRSYYYEKVGFRGVEEKKSLEMLLKEKPIDTSKLAQFCLRFPVPGMYRNLVWSFLLGVLPVYPECRTFVWKQRTEQYQDLKHCLEVMNLIDSTTPVSRVHILMWLLEQNQLKYNHEIQLSSSHEKHLISISQAMNQIFQSEIECYWLAKGLFKNLEKYQLGVHKMKDIFLCFLRKEDETLYSHLIEIDALTSLPLETWFCCCFSGVIDVTALERVWDKVIGGSCKILIFVGLALVLTIRRLLLKSNSTDEVLVCVSHVTEETADVIVNKAVELWQQYGSPLHPCSASDHCSLHKKK